MYSSPISIENLKEKNINLKLENKNLSVVIPLLTYWSMPF